MRPNLPTTLLALTTPFLFPSSIFTFAQSTETESESCDVDSYHDCIDPIAIGSQSLSFEPLFPSPLSFTYAFDVQNATELASESLRPGEEQVPDSKVAFWLEYDDATLTPSARHETYMAVLLNPNITGSPEGGHNGCDGVWGATCSRNLIRFLKEQMAGKSIAATATLSSAIADAKSPSRFGGAADEAAGLGCPDGLFEEVYYGAGMPGFFGGKEETIAMENGESTSILPSGNVTHPFISERILDTAREDLMDRAAVALLARVPLEGDLYTDVANIQLDIVCAAAEEVSEDEYSSEFTFETDGRGEELADIFGSGEERDAAQGNRWSSGLAIAVGILGVVRVVV
ncbi:hypothetical protein BJY01DRAFT_255183 [Aspergillus pseudoustus]|uniref:Uncharacterized protein n=1 Tax=Aspergillus pseudoustus TaxID=1810923 RepID=A0ABR4IQ71_9EURO